MALVPKTLNVTPSAATVTDLYSPGSSKWAVSSSLVIHNDNAALTVAVRVMFAPAAAADANSHRFYDLTIPPNDTFVATLGFILSGTDTFRVYSDTTRTNFFVSVQEGP